MPWFVIYSKGFLAKLTDAQNKFEQGVNIIDLFDVSLVLFPINIYAQ